MDMQDSKLDPELALDLALSERDDVIRAAARMASALKDIYSELGEFPEVETRFNAVYGDVLEYAGQEDRGL